MSPWSSKKKRCGQYCPINFKIYRNFRCLLSFSAWFKLPSGFFFSLLYINLLSNNEYADMHMSLGKYRNNVISTARFCRDRYSLRCHSSIVFRRQNPRMREIWSEAIMSVLILSGLIIVRCDQLKNKSSRRVTYGNPCYSIGSKANSIYFLNDRSVHYYIGCPKIRGTTL
jgi:hypothetical protein